MNHLTHFQNIVIPARTGHRNRKHRRLRMLWRSTHGPLIYLAIMGAMLAAAVAIYNL